MRSSAAAAEVEPTFWMDEGINCMHVEKSRKSPVNSFGRIRKKSQQYKRDFFSRAKAFSETKLLSHGIEWERELFGCQVCGKIKIARKNQTFCGVLKKVFWNKICFRNVIFPITSIVYWLKLIVKYQSLSTKIKVTTKYAWN